MTTLFTLISSHHTGGRLPGVSFYKKQNRPDREEQQSGVACLCHAQQTCNLPRSWPFHLCVCQSRSNKCGEIHRDRLGRKSLRSAFPGGGISTAVLWTASIESLGATKTNSSILVFAQQFCQRKKYGVPPNGFNLPASNVEYGFRQGTLPPVRKQYFISAGGIQHLPKDFVFP